MTKKILAALMAVLLMFGTLAVAASADDKNPAADAPAYTPVEYKIEDLVAAVENSDGVYLNPTDVILLPEAPKPAEGETEDDKTEPAEDANAVSSILIVEYLPGEGGISSRELTKCMDYAGSGYAILGLGDTPDYGFNNLGRNATSVIDYTNENEYAFKNWKIVGIYSGSEFNRIVLEAQWEQPVLSGWAGFKTMLRGYMKTIIDYIIQFINDWMLQLGEFLVGNAN